MLGIGCGPAFSKSPADLAPPGNESAPATKHIVAYEADGSAFRARVSLAADSRIYAKGAREKIARKGLSVRPLYVAGLLYILFFAAFMLSAGAFKTKNGFIRKPALFAGGLFFALFSVEAGFQMLYPGGYVARRFGEIASKHDEDYFFRRDVLETVAPDGGPIWFYDDINKQIESAGGRPAVVFIGDSITYCVGVGEAGQRFSDIAAAELKSEGYDFAVLNLASPGYSTRNERYVMELFTRPLNIKALFVGLFYDDLMNFRYIDGYLWNERFVRMNDNITLESIPLPRSLNDFLFHASSLYQWLSSRQLNRIESVPETVRARKAKWSEQLLALKKYCDGKGAELIVLIMPIHRREMDPEKGGRLQMLPYSWRYDDVEKFAASHRIKTLRVESFFGGMDYSGVSSDMACHYNARGHRIIAEHLAKYIIDNLGNSYK